MRALLQARFVRNFGELAGGLAGSRGTLLRRLRASPNGQSSGCLRCGAGAERNCEAAGWANLGRSEATARGLLVDNLRAVVGGKAAVRPMAPAGP